MICSAHNFNCPSFSFLFYIVLGISTRTIAAIVWHREEDKKVREIFGRYIPSLVHASFSVFWIFVPEMFGGGDDMYNMYGNSGGYFIGDMLIDQDPEYVLHHIAPILWGEAIFRTGSDMYHSMRCIQIVEAGNVVAHTAALITHRSGPYFHKINTISFWISRPLSMPDGFLAWYVGVPLENRYRPFGLILLAMFVLTFYINGKWMLKMVSHRERPEKRETKESQGSDQSTGEVMKKSENGKTDENRKSWKNNRMGQWEKNHKKGGKIEKTRGIEGRKNEKGKKKKGN